MPIPTDDQKKLKKLIDRRHPEYAENLSHWNFLEATYKGGRAWFKNNVFKYLKEGKGEYGDRVERAYRFNHSREIADLINKYIFRGGVQRNEEDAPDAVKRFWKQATRDGRSIDFLMRQSSQRSSVFGRCYVVVDSTARSAPANVAEEKAMKARVFAYLVRPQNVLDFGLDDMGEFEWFLAREVFRDDADPMGDGEIRDRYRLWTRETWHLFDEKKKGKTSTVSLVDSGEHGLGVVPVVPVDHIESDSEYTAPSLIGDIAYLDRAVANYLSNLDAIIQDQTFSQLAMPAQGVLPGEEGYNALLEMGTKRIFLYDGENGTMPHFISPDPKQAGVILAVINKIITEIYHSVGMAGERTKQDNAVGIDNSSGVAKAYDFERMNALLVSKAATLDHLENKLVELVRRWHGEEIGEDERDLVKYPESFDVRGLYDEFEIAERLALIDAPEEMRREQIKSLIDKLFPRIAEDLREKMIKDLETWPPEQPGLMNAPRPSLDDGGESRQGQVTDDGDGKEVA